MTALRASLVRVTFDPRPYGCAYLLTFFGPAKPPQHSFL